MLRTHDSANNVVIGWWPWCEVCLLLVHVGMHDSSKGTPAIASSSLCSCDSCFRFLKDLLDKSTFSLPDEDWWRMLEYLGSYFGVTGLSAELLLEASAQTRQRTKSSTNKGANSKKKDMLEESVRRNILVHLRSYQESRVDIVHSFGTSTLDGGCGEWRPHFGSGERVIDGTPGHRLDNSSEDKSAIFAVGALVLMPYVLGRAFVSSHKLTGRDMVGNAGLEIDGWFSRVPVNSATRLDSPEPNSYASPQRQEGTPNRSRSQARWQHRATHRQYPRTGRFSRWPPR